MAGTYKLGSFAGGTSGITGLSFIAGVDPQPTEFLEYSEIVGVALSAKPVESGPARVKWDWDYLPQGGFDALTQYCTGSSAEVYIQTRVNSGSSYTYGVFRATMTRPRAKTVPGLNRKDIEVVFINLRTPP